ncbi:hypothetical protein IVB06_29510 [Bradyrhizobium sp. 171]|nr:hypothetical protein [Bradyrhizobium sp. 87]MCK1536519.1 hypothetical protein [Bradyrhizobium sp. 176]MCK1549525.1 hypothetical protein [Bradyrhizobium sp. 177]MCK1560366.1 hypothetical protein [Bradyrhizobium sp. 171]MCK1587727.1 hypothetical protein [Bradyrhizobium sp. 169]MCK1698250.1 hypothetical protein [Bradyrhizobium sp. 144]UPJ95015.1 hypothetical protein IVB07_32505 [Bradyrhizobium sp. 172]
MRSQKEGSWSMQISGGRREEPSSSRNEAEVDAQPSPSEAQQTRKITIQLSECIFQRLEAATDRPGMGKSVVVEAALERFLDPAPRIEGLVYEAIERTNKQVLSLRTDIAVIAETVALHVRYHLTLTPPMPPSKQDEACVLGLERFKAFAEQVDRRVRFGRPLLQEAIDSSGSSSRSGPELGGGASRAVPRAPVEEETHCVAVVGENSNAGAVAEEGGSNIHFRQLPNALC